MPRKDPTLNGTYKVLIRRAKKTKAVEYKGGCCEKCKGVFSPCVYDFHHVDPTTKESSKHRINCFLDKSWGKLKPELDKCILLCANCHRLEHYEIKQS